MQWEINKDTTLCLSLSARPSNFGTRFHNFLYRELDLNFAYKGCATQDIEGAMRGLRALGIRGSAVSMPFKEQVIQYLDELDTEAAHLGAVNTVVNTNRTLKGYNTDVIAVRNLLQQRLFPHSLRTVVLGSGGMAKSVVKALHDSGFRDVTIVARNSRTGQALAEHYGYAWRPELATNEDFGLLVNVTPIGMAPDPEGTLPFPENMIWGASHVLDVVANPPETALILLAASQKKAVISGFDIVVLQAVEQFRLYTGITPTSDAVVRAARHARG